jgi:hypothetical protein
MIRNVGEITRGEAQELDDFSAPESLAVSVSASQSVSLLQLASPSHWLLRSELQLPWVLE